MECDSNLWEALGNNALQYRTVVRWVGKFLKERVSATDEQRSERPVSERTDVARVKPSRRAVIKEVRRWMLLELERANGFEKRTVHRILRNEQLLCKIASRWVPHALTKVQKLVRYAICSDHLGCWQQNGDQFLSRIITINEFWINTYEPELKYQSEE